MSRFNKTLEVTISIVHREKEKFRCYLNWLHSTLTAKYAQLIASDLSGDPTTEVYRMGLQTDIWCFKYEPVQEFEIPHYVNLTVTDTGEEDYVNRVCVALSGRRTHCSCCHQDTHWDSKCPTKAEKQAKRPTIDPQRQKP
jgi:hypothetical protein